MSLKYFAILDTETNSLPNKNIEESGLPVQISMIITNLDFIPISTINVFIKQNYLDPSAVAVHGFDFNRLEELKAMNPAEAHDFLYEENDINWEEVIGIAHNSNFDKNVLEKFSNQCGRVPKINKYLDTLKFYKSIKDPNKKNNKLESILEWLGYDRMTLNEITKVLYKSSNSYHDARFDTSALLYALYKTKNEFINFYSNDLVL